MRPSFPLRLIVTLAVLIGAGTVAVTLLVATDTFLSIWQRLEAFGPVWVVFYLSAIAIAAVAIGILSWRFLAPARPKPKSAEIPDSEELRLRIEQRKALGIETTGAEAELAELERRREAAELYLAIFGETSAGKSTLVKTLLPEASVQTDVRGGTTQDIQAYQWKQAGDMNVRLVDLPGFGQPGSALDVLAREEAVRAHVAIYVADGDMSRTQHDELQQLAAFGKPIMLVINKSDRYSEGALVDISQRLRKSVPPQVRQVVPVTAGGEEEILRVDASGRERLVVQQRKPDVSALLQGLQDLLGDPGTLEQARDLASLRLASEKLRQAEDEFRAQKAEALVESYSRRAVVVSMAAIAPGTDLVLQGALGAKLIHDLLKLYEVRAREVDVDQFLALAGKKVRKTTSVLLAVAGNALKAFPGMGTVAGGLVHAVCYGMIFESLGKAAAQTLATENALKPEITIQRFEEKLVENLPARASRFARLAIKARKDG